ncbi:MAG: NADH-quinone oxidoreductase subunit L, partial [Betaproteobacteria bacterium]
IAVDAERHTAMEELAKAFHGPLAMAEHALTSPITWLAAAGVFFAWLFYLRMPELPAVIQRRFAVIYRILDNKYYMDWFNENVIAAAARALGVGLWKGGDVGLIDGALNGSADGVGSVAGLLRRVQTGYLYWYALVMILGVVGLMTWQLWPFLSGLMRF